MKSIRIAVIEKENVEYYREANMVEAIAKVNQLAEKAELTYVSGFFADNHFAVQYRYQGGNTMVSFTGVLDEI